MEISLEQKAELTSALDAVYGTAGTVEDLKQNTKGADTVILSLRYEHDPLPETTTLGNAEIEPVDLIMRIFARSDAGDAFRRAKWEFEVLDSLHKSSISVPKPICLVDSKHGAAYLVMERVLGTSMGDRFLELVSSHGRDDEAAQLIFQFMTKMVQIHEVPPESLQIPRKSEELEALRADPKQALTRMLEWPRRTIERCDIIELRPVLQWLDETLETLTDVSIAWTHGDFHPENIIVNQAGDLVVIDWSNIGLSDPRIDLAFAIGVINAFGDGSDFSERLTGLYQQISGRTISHIGFFSLLSIFHNVLRMYSMVNDFQIAGENESTRQVMLKEYLVYSKMMLKIVKDVTGHSIPSVEAYIRSTTN